MNDNMMKQAYLKALKRERDRDRRRRTTRQGGFDASHLHLDQQPEGDSGAERRETWESDGGRGAEAIRSFDEPRADEGFYARRIKAAREALRRRAPHLVAPFNLLVRARFCRAEALAELMSAKGLTRKAARDWYSSRLRNLLVFFGSEHASGVAFREKKSYV